jgi:hypothetical protein
MAKVEKTFKELTLTQQDMVTALALGLTASEQSSNKKLNYTAQDICSRFDLKRTSFAAVKANITRRYK